MGERIRTMLLRLDDYESVIDARPPDMVSKLFCEDLYFDPAAARRTDIAPLVSS